MQLSTHGAVPRPAYRQVVAGCVALALALVLAVTSARGAPARQEGIAAPQGSNAAGAIAASMQRDLVRLQAAAATQQSALVDAHHQQEVAQVAAIADGDAAKVWDTGTRHMPIAGAALLRTIVPVIDAHAKQTGHDAAHAQFELDLATRQAASTVADLASTERRLAAFRRALGQQTARDRALLAGGAAAAQLIRQGNFPRTGWGGTESSVTPEKIDAYLQSKASPIAGNGVYFLQAGVQYGVDPRLVVAIAGAESYFGLETCGSYNAWGWACPSNPATFASWADAIDTVTRGLRRDYLDQGRTSVLAIHAKYSPVGASNDPTNLNLAWPVNVAKFLVEQGGNPQDVQGPGAPRG